VKAQVAIYGTLVCLKAEDEYRAYLRIGELEVLEVDSKGVFIKFKDGYYVSYELDEVSIVYPSGYNAFKYWCAEKEDEIRERVKIASKTEEGKG